MQQDSNKIDGSSHQDPTTGCNSSTVTSSSLPAPTTNASVTAAAPVAVRREKRRPPSLFSAPPMVREATSSPSLPLLQPTPLLSSQQQQPSPMIGTAATITRTTSNNTESTVPQTPLQQLALPPSSSMGPSSQYQCSTSGQLSDNPSFATNTTMTNVPNMVSTTPHNSMPPALDLSMPGSTTSQRAAGGLTPVITAARGNVLAPGLQLNTPSLRQMPQFTTGGGIAPQSSHRLSPSTFNVPSNCGPTNNLVHLSPDGTELCVGDFVVTRNGCATIKNHLLMNPIDVITMTPKLVPKATPQLRSTRLEDPISPLIYSNDAFPHDSVSIVGGGGLLLSSGAGNRSNSYDGATTTYNIHSANSSNDNPNVNMNAAKGVISEIRGGGPTGLSTPLQTSTPKASGKPYGWLTSPAPMREGAAIKPRRVSTDASDNCATSGGEGEVPAGENGNKTNSLKLRVEDDGNPLGMGNAITSDPSSNATQEAGSPFFDTTVSSNDGCRPLFRIESRRGTAALSTTMPTQPLMFYSALASGSLPLPIANEENNEASGESTSNAMLASTSSSAPTGPLKILGGTPPPPGGLFTRGVGASAISISSNGGGVGPKPEEDDRPNSCVSPFASTLPIAIVPTMIASPHPEIKPITTVTTLARNATPSPLPANSFLTPTSATPQSQIRLSADAIRSPNVTASSNSNRSAPAIATPPLIPTSSIRATFITTPSSSLPPLPPSNTTPMHNATNTSTRRTSQQTGAVSPSSTYSRCSPTTTTAANNPPTPFASLTGLSGTHNCYQLRYCDLEILGPIDKGASATVFKAKHRETQKTFAVKCIDLSDLLEDSSVGRGSLQSGQSLLHISPKLRQLHHIVYRELQMLHSEYRSAHVLKMYDAFFDPDLCTLNICMEYMHWGSLVHLGFLMSPIGKHRVPLPERLLAVIAEQVLHGLKDMHSKGHVHRDIKPGNVLVNSSGVVKLSDFGLVETISNIAKNEGEMEDGEIALCSGTDKYMSPERQKGERHGPPSDVWALGMTLAECAIGKYAVDTSKAKDGFERIALMSKVRYPPSIDLSKDFKDFVEQCMRANPDDRPTAAQLLDHPLLCRWNGEYNLADKLQTAIKRQEAYEEDLERNRRHSEHRRVLQEEWADRYMDKEMGGGVHRGLGGGKKKSLNKRKGRISTPKSSQQSYPQIQGIDTPHKFGTTDASSPTMSSNASSNHNASNNALNQHSNSPTTTSPTANTAVPRRHTTLPSARTPTSMSTAGGKRDRDKRKEEQFKRAGLGDLDDEVFANYANESD